MHLMVRKSQLLYSDIYFFSFWLMLEKFGDFYTYPGKKRWRKIDHLAIFQCQIPLNDIFQEENILIVHFPTELIDDWLSVSPYQLIYTKLLILNKSNLCLIKYLITLSSRKKNHKPENLSTNKTFTIFTYLEIQNYTEGITGRFFICCSGRLQHQGLKQPGAGGFVHVFHMRGMGQNTWASPAVFLRPFYRNMYQKWNYQNTNWCLSNTMAS